MNIRIGFHGKSAIIVCHDVMFGPPHELRDFLLGHNMTRLVFIGHRNRAVSENNVRRSYCAIYRNSVKMQTVHAPDISRFPEFAAYAIDSIWTLYWILRFARRTDYYFGLGNMNACVGLILRFVGSVRRVVYYVIDYIPNRFSNKFVNRFYMKLDYWAAAYSDATWNYAPKMVALREKMWRQTFLRQYVVPNGIRMRVSVPLKKDMTHIDLMYVGTIHRQQGIQLIIEALPLIKKNIPLIRLFIIGQGSYKKDLDALIRKKKLVKHVRFLGYIENPNKVDERLTQGYIGVATYTPDNVMVRNTEPGKIKRYLACGLPVIMTDTGSITKLIQTAGCGISVPYDAPMLAQELVRLISNKKQYEIMQKKAIEFAKKYDWEHLFSQGFQSIENSL